MLITLKLAASKMNAAEKAQFVAELNTYAEAHEQSLETNVAYARALTVVVLGGAVAIEAGAVSAAIACLKDAVCINEAAIALGEAAAGDALGGASLAGGLVLAGNASDDVVRAVDGVLDDVAKKGAGHATKGGRPPVANPTSAQLATAEHLGVDARWVKADGSIDWPPNYGFDGPPTITELQPGQTFDRYGGRYENGQFIDEGTFASPPDVPFGERALPSSSQNSPHMTYEIVQPIPGVNSGLAAPWFDQPGGGTQYQLPFSIDYLVKNGFIRPVN